MSLSDLVFLACFLASVVTLLSVGVIALRGFGARALALLRTWALCAAVYFAIVIGASLVWPRTELRLGQPRCFDDWCIAVDGATHGPVGGSTQTPAEAARNEPAGGKVAYTVTLRIVSRARRVSQHEYNMAVYVTDSAGRRYDPVPLASDVPFDSFVGPGQTVPVTRRFDLPAGVRDPVLIVSHEGGFSIGWLIIGYETWFHKPAFVRLP
jgi:hypothetical protein